MPPTRITLWNLRKMRRFPDGEPIGVIRPSNPTRAMELVKELEANPNSRNSVWSDQLWKAMENQIVEECGPYTFVGYLSRATPKKGERPKILDEHGKPIDVTNDGDSFIRTSDWKAVPHAEN